MLNKSKNMFEKFGFRVAHAAAMHFPQLIFTGFSQCLMSAPTVSRIVIFPLKLKF
jgi:hypothetical protein